jgi:hypothetical protein
VASEKSTKFKFMRKSFETLLIRDETAWDEFSVNRKVIPKILLMQKSMGERGHEKMD